MNKLKWMGHAATMLGIQCALLNDDKSCEVVLATSDGASERAHMFILCTCSDLMRELLKDLSPGQEATIILPDVRGDLLESILSFIYVGQTSLPADSLTEFMEALNLLGVKAPIKFKCISDCDLQIEDTDFVDVDEEDVREEDEDDDFFDEETGFKAKIEEEEEIMFEEESMPGDPFTSSAACTDAEMDEADVEDDGDAEDDVGDIFDLMEMDDEMSTEKPKPKGRQNPSPKEKRPAIKQQEKKADHNNEDKDHITDAIELAVDAVIRTKLSLQKAADRYDISKTVLWRRVRHSPEYIRNNLKNPLLAEAHNRLKKGHPLKTIAAELKIPMSTLHRHKMRLAAEGQLPKYRDDGRRDTTPKEELKERLPKALHACLHGGMTLNHAADLFEISKSTLWRHLQPHKHKKTTKSKYKSKKKEAKEE